MNAASRLTGGGPLAEPLAISLNFSSEEIATKSIVLDDGFTMLMTHDVTQDEVDHFFRDVDC